MKILYIYGNASSFDYGLNGLLKRTKGVFSELDAQTETVDLGVLHPPYYDGDTTTGIDGVMEKIAAADGVVLACTAQNFVPTALMQSFFEYLPSYPGAFLDKHFMLVTLSISGGELSAGDYLVRLVHSYGGFAVARIGLQQSHLEQATGIAGDFIDKTTEDFYRAVHQRRKYVIPSDDIERGYASETREHPRRQDPPKTASFTDTQEQEIDELSSLVLSKFQKSEPEPVFVPEPIFAPEPIFEPEGVLDSLKPPEAPPAPEIPPPPKPPIMDANLGPVENLTRRLPEFYKPELSAGLQAIIQFNITGNEKFDGYINLHSTECDYTEGEAPGPDITIIADADIWADVLANKNTAQKAFMTGGIKVRGDFVLLTKFDRLFEFPPA